MSLRKCSTCNSISRDMGQVQPAPDERLDDVIELLRLKQKDVQKLFSIFRAMDGDKSGVIDVTEFYKYIREPQSIWADHIFDLIDTESDGVLEFSEFVHAVATYSMFSKAEMYQFAFYVFDKDKSGYIEPAELVQLLNVLHAQSMGFSNLRESVLHYDKDGDGKISFEEFQTIVAKFPQLLYPAFKLQVSIMKRVMGTRWWQKKQDELQDRRDAERALADEIEHREDVRERSLARGRVRRKMGPLKYYLCPLMREEMIDEETGVNAEDVDELSSGSESEEDEEETAEEKEKAKEKAKARAERRAARKERKRKAREARRRRKKRSKRSGSGQDAGGRPGSKRRRRKRLVGPASRSEEPTPTMREALAAVTQLAEQRATGATEEGGRRSFEARRARRAERRERRETLEEFNARAFERMVRGRAKNRAGRRAAKAEAEAAAAAARQQSGAYEASLTERVLDRAPA